MPLARICAGGGQQWPSLPRPVSRAAWVAQGVFQSELRNRLRHPWLRTIRPASLDGVTDILNFFLALRVVNPTSTIGGMRCRIYNGLRFHSVTLARGRAKFSPVS